MHIIEINKTVWNELYNKQNNVVKVELGKSVLLNKKETISTS